MDIENAASTVRLLTPKDIQCIFQISRNSAYELMHSPSFPSFMVNSRLYVSEASLLEWIKSYEGKRYLI